MHEELLLGTRAMVSSRSYNDPRSHGGAVAELRAEAGTQFDPRVVEAFLDTYPERNVPR